MPLNHIDPIFQTQIIFYTPFRIRIFQRGIDLVEPMIILCCIPKIRLHVSAKFITYCFNEYDFFITKTIPAQQPAISPPPGTAYFVSCNKHNNSFTNFRYFPHIKIAFPSLPKNYYFCLSKNIAMNTIPYIVADNKIPYLKGILEPYARIDYLSPNR